MKRFSRVIYFLLAACTGTTRNRMHVRVRQLYTRRKKSHCNSESGGHYLEISVTSHDVKHGGEHPQNKQPRQHTLLKHWMLVCILACIYKYIPLFLLLLFLLVICIYSVICAALCAVVVDNNKYLCMSLLVRRGGVVVTGGSTELFIFTVRGEIIKIKKRSKSSALAPR